MNSFDATLNFPTENHNGRLERGVYYNNNATGQWPRTETDRIQGGVCNNKLLSQPWLPQATCGALA